MTPRKANCGGRSLSVATIRIMSRSENRRVDRTGPTDRQAAEDPPEEGRDSSAAIEPGAAGIFADMQQAEHCIESEASRNYDVYCGAILRANDYAAGDADGASGAQSGIGRSDL